MPINCDKKGHSPNVFCCKGKHSKISYSNWAVVEHAFNASTWDEVGRCLSLKPAWSNERDPGQLRRYRAIMSWSPPTSPSKEISYSRKQVRFESSLTGASWDFHLSVFNNSTPSESWVWWAFHVCIYARTYTHAYVTLNIRAFFIASYT